MDSVLLVETIYDENENTYSNASLTGEEVINILKENNYEVIPMLRIHYKNSQTGYNENYIIYSPLNYYVSSSTASSDDIILKRSLCTLTNDGPTIFITYDTGEIIASR